jgi:hypothetical protein
MMSSVPPSAPPAGKANGSLSMTEYMHAPELEKSLPDGGCTTALR